MSTKIFIENASVQSAGELRRLRAATSQPCSAQPTRWCEVDHLVPVFNQPLPYQWILHPYPQARFHAMHIP